MIKFNRARNFLLLTSGIAYIHNRIRVCISYMKEGYLRRDDYASAVVTGPSCTVGE